MELREGVYARYGFFFLRRSVIPLAYKPMSKSVVGVHVVQFRFRNRFPGAAIMYSSQLVMSLTETDRH